MRATPTDPSSRPSRVALIPGTEVQTSGSMVAGSSKVLPTPWGRKVNSYGGGGHSTGGWVVLVATRVVVGATGSDDVVVPSPVPAQARSTMRRTGRDLVMAAR
jgi:hypothetical protein